MNLRSLLCVGGIAVLVLPLGHPNYDLALLCFSSFFSAVIFFLMPAASDSWEQKHYPVLKGGVPDWTMNMVMGDPLAILDIH